MRITTFTSAALTIGLAGCLSAPNDMNGAIDSFEDCAAAGYPIMESYPEQCRTPDGRTFVRDISDDQVDNTDLITVDMPAPGDILTETVIVSGAARGQWYFEATFPVDLEDGNGVTVLQTYAEAQSNWMTTDWVPFTATVTIPAVTSSTGTLVLRKSNASGLPEHDASIRIPVRFR